MIIQKLRCCCCWLPFMGAFLVGSALSLRWLLGS